MNCQFCRSQLPKEARVCPTCGNLNPTYNTAAYDATVPSAGLPQVDISKGPITAPLLTPPKAQSFYDQTAHGTPTLNDALTVPDNYGWDNYSQGGNTSCSFSGDAYHAKAKPGYFSPCYAKATNYSDFIFQAQLTMVTGHSGG